MLQCKCLEKKIHDGCSVWITNSITRVTVRHHTAFNPHLTTINNSYILFPIRATHWMNKSMVLTKPMCRLIWTFMVGICDCLFTWHGSNQLTSWVAGISVTTLPGCKNNKINMRRDMTKPTKWVCAQRRLRSAWASAQSDQSLCCPHEESLDP